MPLNLQLILLQPRHVQFLARGTALELPRDVLIIVTDNTAQNEC